MMHAPAAGLPARLLSLIAVTLLAGGCTRDEGAAAVQAPTVEGNTIRFAADSPQLKVLRSEEVADGSATILQLPARVTWDDTRSSMLRSPLPGQIARIDAVPGQKIKAGQVLAWVASPEFGQVQAEGARGAAELRQARNELVRVRELHEAGVASGRELGEAESALAVSEAEHARLQALTRYFGNGRGIDQRMPLRSPINGVLVERRMSPGMAVSADAEAPLAVVSDPDRLWLIVDVPESLAGRLRAGMAVRVAPGQGEATEAVLGHVDDYVDSERHVVQARAELDNRARRFKAGQYVRASITVPMDGGVSLPEGAVLLLGREQMVFVDEGKGQFVRRSVQAEELGQGRLWIGQGMAAGTRVVVDGSLLLQQVLDQHVGGAEAGAGHATAGRTAP
ncbi:efflux RND transporter periplasmic adaptor subunit [Stenotrophomonas tumulicola]|uniref:Efflux RND transporter periplasmic adaptor subunit n=1 Tax=Stenotrophomonas tumulicola TaxID=1685415 RepID=A0A7W3FK51_9GAMM|nr:efflux RND transporter periplasmic adaptor subunit [Stenotrophomonas tumulicola]MBA8680984.1 efflux RND transporter periplasmic adaptor subunit [Stenotrophomonas tumulicola]